RSQVGWRAFVPALSVLTIIAAINGGWALRNVALFGVTTDSRGSIALSTREVFAGSEVGRYHSPYWRSTPDPHTAPARTVFAADRGRPGGCLKRPRRSG